ncbi:RDD family protein [Ornithinibacillus gellani]|uniref:RDD family protein n=1 Tax=Ornithinibacillus gellani TaxID=2293253 RepID=UPI000F4A8D0B|nr:RDD family protein [Ornithinibacillus gellani]TQS71874.1 RDD family protein [Ornithinibacillus gellani]
MNAIPIKKRFIELLVDYLVIVVYLIILFIINLFISFLIFKGLPEYNEIQAQSIATLTSVIPIIVIFTYLDYVKNGSIGKRVAGLTLTYKHKKISSSLLRNIVKFLPWQMGHIGVIHGIYSNFDMSAILIANSGTILGLILICMGLFRNDKRHLGDLLAGTKVELR